MTKIATDFASKLAVAFVAVAMIFAAFAPAAQAQTTEDLQQMINDLLAQVAQLQGQTSGGTGSSVMNCSSFLSDLSQGTSNAEVMRLQQFLNMDPDTRVAAAGSVGSAGMETEFYGPATAAAVSKFQVKYRAEILSPLGLVNPTGYWGAGSRAKANALCSETVVTTPDTDEEATDEDEEDDVELGGTAVLGTFEVDDASDNDIQEGDSDVEVATFDVEFENGDAEIAYMDISIVGTDANANPWDAFETFSLWVDGDMIAEVNADDEDDYLDEDDGTLRFTNLSLIAMEDEEIEIVIGASVQNNLDDEELDDSDNDEWNLYAYEMRYFDADGVATTEGSQEDLQDDASGAAANFSIEEEGEGEELNISLSSSNPDSTDIIVDEDDNTDGVTIFSFEMEAEEGDIELDRVVVLVETDGASTTAVVDDVTLSIDGMTFDAENVESAFSSTNPSTLTSRFDNVNEEAVWYVFDIDGDVVIDEDDELEAELMIDFNSQSGNFSNGQQITASIGNNEKTYWVAEGADDLVAPADFSGSAVGDEHTVVAEGIVVPVDGVTVEESTSGDNDQTGSFEIDFEVTAVEADFYVFDRVTEGAFNATTTGVTFSVDGPGSATSSGVLSSTADEDNSNPNFFVVREGETETFTMTVTVDASASGQHRVSLTGVGYSDDNVNDDADDDAYQPVPTQDFRTGYVNINAN